MLSLRQLTLNDKVAFMEGLEAFSGEDLHWYSFIWHAKMEYNTMLDLLQKEHLGIDLAPDRVQHTMFYAFVNDKIVGRLSVRHKLNEYLKIRGGHLGYAVAPKYRRKGYAKEIMKQAIEICSLLNINPILITCDDNNTASIKIIEHFGGALENIISESENSEKVRRYWIKI